MNFVCSFKFSFSLSHSDLNSDSNKLAFFSNFSLYVCAHTVPPCTLVNYLQFGFIPSYSFERFRELWAVYILYMLYASTDFADGLRCAGKWEKKKQSITIIISTIIISVTTLYAFFHYFMPHAPIEIWANSGCNFTL